MRRERYLWFSGEGQRLFFARARAGRATPRAHWLRWDVCVVLVEPDVPVWRRPADAVDSRSYIECVDTLRRPGHAPASWARRARDAEKPRPKSGMCIAAPMAVTLSETHPHTPHTAGGARGHTRATAPARATQHHSSSPSTHCGHTGYQVAWVHSFCGPRCRDTPATVLAAGHGP